MARKRRTREERYADLMMRLPNFTLMDDTFMRYLDFSPRNLNTTELCFRKFLSINYAEIGTRPPCR